MIPTRSLNWEEEILTTGLSARARRVGVAYTGPGSGDDVPVARGPERPPIAFMGGIPDPASLPIDELQAALERVLRLEGHDALQYGRSQGLLGLRGWLAEHWSKIDGLDLTADHFTLTNGSAGALANICDTFLNPGDIVLIESPSFPGSIRAIRSFGVEMEAASMDDEGLDVAALADQLARLEESGRRAKLLYTIPNYHNPTGSCLSLERRQRLVELCERYDVLIVEDDAYGEISFDAELPRSLFSLARGRGVIKAGSFSKIVATGLRVGWCLATPPIVTALLGTRFELGGTPIVQRMLLQYARDGALDAHIADVRRVYERKRDVMMNELRERCSGLATWREPEGGFFVWLRLNDGIDPVALQDAAREEGVVFAAGQGFFVNGGAGGIEPSRYIRLAYSYTAEADMPEGVRRLARAMERAATRE